MIEIDGVSFAHGRTAVLTDVSLTIPRGGVTALLGPNGAGKSTLLSLIGRLRPLQAGRITVDGLPVDRTPGRVLARALAVLRQETAIATRVAVRDLVGFGRFPHSRGRMTAEDRAIVAEALDRFELEPLAHRFVDTLSGGQRQRALVAMCFCQGTPAMLLDEPLASLDLYHARQLMRLVRRAADEDGRTIVIVLHDVNHAARYADRIVALKAGRVVDAGPTEAVLTPDLLERVYGCPVDVLSHAGRPAALVHP